jgi:hypothetical protein
MSTLGIQPALMNQPVEVSGLRSQFQNAMEMGASLPQRLVWFGYADQVAKNPIPRSLRRPVEQVILL